MMLFSQFLNIGLRGGTLLGKFALILLLARYLEPAELGVYGLFVVTVSYSTYLLGLDFYTFSTRELLGKDAKLWPEMLRDLAVFYGLTYLVVLPLLFAVFVADFIPIKFLGWFYSVLVVEHLGQETYRLLIAMGKPVRANIMHFVRAGAWCYIAGVLLIMGSGAGEELELVFKLWVVGGIGALSVGLSSLVNLEWSGVWKLRVNWAWIGQGIRVAGFLLIGTLFLRGILTFDRYFLKLYQGDEAVGVYTFFITVCMAVQSFLDAGLLAFVYPKMIESYRKGRLHDYDEYLKKLRALVVFGSIFLGAIVAVLIYPIMLVIGKELYIDNVGIFVVVLGAVLMHCFGLVPHYQLYAREYDRFIVGAHALGFCVFLTLAVWLIPVYGLYGASWSLLISFIAVFAAKMIGNQVGRPVVA